MREYIERTYRSRISKRNLTTFQVVIRETDLFVTADLDLTAETRESVHRHRRYIESYIETHPEFLRSLVPVSMDHFAPDIVLEMLDVSANANVGPMAAVAGAVAQFTGTDLMPLSTNVIVENGGDIFIKSVNDVNVGIFAGDSPLSFKVSLKIKPEMTPIGVCTSSGTVGPSLSLGRADAVCVVAKSVSLADAAATSIGNRVKGKDDIMKGIARAREIDGILGVVIILGEKMGVWGDIELA